MSSTELLDAASISTTSSDVAEAIETHDSHVAARRRPSAPPFWQFSDAARILAIDVLPVPARADEQVRVVDAVLLDRVGERPDDVLLARRRRRTCGGDDGGTEKRPRGCLSLVAPLRPPRACARADLRSRLGALVALASLDPRRLPQLRHRLRLLWGGDLAHGRRRTSTSRSPPPPHPLATLLGVAPHAVRRRRPADLGRDRVPRARRARRG